MIHRNIGRGREKEKLLPNSVAEFVTGILRDKKLISNKDIATSNPALRILKVGLCLLECPDLHAVGGKGAVEMAPAQRWPAA
jgi:hypothetical protein